MAEQISHFPENGEGRHVWQKIQNCPPLAALKAMSRLLMIEVRMGLKLDISLFHLLIFWLFTFVAMM